MKYSVLWGWFTLCVLLTMGCSSGTVADKFAARAERENKSYPQKLNNSITVDSTAYDKATNTVSYYYSVTGALDDLSYMAAHYATFWAGLKAEVENSVAMKDYVQAQCTIRYIYYSNSTHQQLAEFAYSY